MLGGIGFFVKTFVRGKENSYAPFPVETRDKLIAVGIGAFGGFIVGLTSVGSGTFFGLAMLILFPLSAARVVGTDIFQAAALLWVAGVGHMIAGNVDFHATGWLLIGSIPGVLIGSNVSVRLPDRALRVALATTLRSPGSGCSRCRVTAMATTLTLSGIRLLEVPGARFYIPVTLAFVGVGVLWSWARSRQSAAAAGTGGSGHETKGLPVSQQPSLYASQPVQNPVTAASSASAATIEPSTAPAIDRPDRVGERRRGQEDGADDVREAGRARVLERPLAEARLHELEVGEARQAAAPPEDEADDSCAPRSASRNHQPVSTATSGQDADGGLVEPGRPGVDHVGVAVRVGAALHKVKSYQSSA